MSSILLVCVLPFLDVSGPYSSSGSGLTKSYLKTFISLYNSTANIVPDIGSTQYIQWYDGEEWAMTAGPNDRAGF